MSYFLHTFVFHIDFAGGNDIISVRIADKLISKIYFKKGDLL